MTRLPALLLAPVISVQGMRLRRTTPRMAPAVPRTGGSQAAGALRLLVIGDSTAVGTGVEHMHDALPGRLAPLIGAQVAWRVLGANGLRADQVRAQHLPAALGEPADRIVLLAGWNDAQQLRSAAAYAADLAAMIERLSAANPAARIVVVAPPRFGQFAVYPQPLRAALGAHTAGLTRAAQRVAQAHGVALIPGFDGVHVAADRFHPDATGYSRLAEEIAASLA